MSDSNGSGSRFPAAGGIAVCYVGVRAGPMAAWGAASPGERPPRASRSLRASREGCFAVILHQAPDGEGGSANSRLGLTSETGGLAAIVECKTGFKG